MNFSLPVKLNKRLILSKVSEEEIMSFYLNIPIKKGLFCSPLRTDRRPTCSLFRNSRGDLIFKDFATGQYLNCFEVVKVLYSCDYIKALQIIANDFNIVKSETIPKNKGKIKSIEKIEDKEVSRIQVQIQDFTELELKWWASYGITEDILKKYRVFSCKYVFLNGNLCAESKQHCPIFGYYGGITKEYGEKIELWRCYFPKRKSYRFLTNWSANKIQGFEQLPKKGKILVITKAMKDVMALHAYGIPAIAPNSEHLFVSDTVLDNLKERFKYIIVLYDVDLPGIDGMKKIKKEHPELTYLFIPRKYEAKDFSDLRKKYGYNKTKDLILEYINYFKNEKIGVKHSS